MDYVLFECDKTKQEVKISKDNCKKQIIRKRFGKGPAVFYCETTGRHEGNVYKKLETVK